MADERAAPLNPSGCPHKFSPQPYDYFSKVWSNMLLNSSFWRSNVYFLAEFLHSVLARYSLFSLIFSYNNHYVIIFGYNRVLFGGIFRQKVHG